MLESDATFRAFFEQRSGEVPEFYVDRIRKDLGPMWHWLPDGALYHDSEAYLKSAGENVAVDAAAAKFVA
jgi:hypothetical protein